MMSSKRAAIITALACLAPVVSHSFGRSIYGLLLPAIEDDLLLTHSQAGIPSSGIFVLYVVGVLWVLFTSPWVEPVTIMRVSLAVSCAGLVLAATANDLPALTIGVSLAGGAGAGIWMTAPVLATEYVSEQRRGVVLGALTSTIGVSNIALGFGVSALRRSTGNDLLWRPMWWLAIALTMSLLVAMVVYARFAPTERVKTTKGLDFANLRKVVDWKAITIAYALFGGVSAGFNAFIVAALEEHGGWSRSASTVIFSIVGIASMIAAPVAGGVSDKIGRIAVMRFALVVLIGANAAVAWGGWTVALGAVAYGAAASSFPALIAAHLRDSLDNRAFSQALAMMTILFSLLSAVVPAALGAVADNTASFAWPYAVLGAMSAGALAVLTLVRRALPVRNPEVVA